MVKRFVTHVAPWFLRGDAMNLGLGAGVFAFNNEIGRANGNVSFRVFHKLWIKIA